LAVLVNGGSASASEIVSGAIQDHDRGIVVGQKTFGKGRVQSVLPLGEGTALKITTSKYYISSGRCIQKEDYLKWKNSAIISEYSLKDTTDSDDLMTEEDYFYQDLSKADSSLEKEEEKLPEYKTTGGRIVYGGGGIMPDIELKTDLMNKLEIELERKSMFFGFALDYASKHKDLPPDFIVTDKIVSEFKQYLKDHNFSYKTRSEEELETFEKQLENAHHKEEINAQLQSFRAILLKEKEADFEKSLTT
jgi:carboxyl-terminal processing protease